MTRTESIALAAGVVIIALGLARVAHGHDDAAWIGNGPFKGKDGVHCCGKEDCEAVGPEYVRKVDSTADHDGGYEVVFRGLTYFVAHGDHYGSIDEQVWMCGFGREGRHREGCAFIPRDGS